MASKELNLKFLDLAGFTPEEAAEILPDWLEVVETFDLTDEIVRHAVEEYIPQCWDIQYRGVRKMIGAFVHELIDLVHTKKMKAEGKKILYGILPALYVPYNSIKLAGGDDVYVAFPDAIIVTALNSIFDAAGPILSVAEEANFTYGCRHCPLNKTRYAGFLKGFFATPDIVWSWGMICDEGPQTDQFIQGMLGDEWQYIISRLPHDQYWGDLENENEERVAYLASVIKHDMEKVCDILDIHPTPEQMMEVIAEGNRVLGKIAKINAIVASTDPAPLRAFEASMVQTVFGFVWNTGVKYMEEAMDILIPELEQAVAEGRGVAPKGATRIGTYYTPMVLPWVDKMFLDNGCITVMSEMSAITQRLLTPSAYTDPFMALAQQWLQQTPPVNLGLEVEDQTEKVLNSNVDGVYMGFFDFDRWLGAQQKMLAELVEKRTGVPHFYIEADFWDDRDYGVESLRTRVESICQVVEMKKEQRLAAEAE